jgi:hypothetical protein
VTVLNSLDGTVCYPLADLRHVYDMADLAASAASQAARSPGRASAGWVRAMDRLRWVGSYLVSYSFCGLSHSETRKRVEERLLRSQLIPDTADGDRMRRVAVHFWTAGVEGATNEIRRLLPVLADELREMRVEDPKEAAAVQKVLSTIQNNVQTGK